MLHRRLGRIRYHFMKQCSLPNSVNALLRDIHFCISSGLNIPPNNKTLSGRCRIWIMRKFTGADGFKKFTQNIAVERLQWGKNKMMINE